MHPPWSNTLQLNEYQGQVQVLGLGLGLGLALVLEMECCNLGRAIHHKIGIEHDVHQHCTLGHRGHRRDPNCREGWVRLMSSGILHVLSREVSVADQMKSLVVHLTTQCC